ncbi:hypothetical protein ACB098_12G048600 [Castanea mollissima]|uniref:Late embryogenesis abundant protein LEA-2 subgroup domain-containing protein n=1 Tax=Castanea mollissima TaxID=60419 RepID=A0A8J4QB11_9ROSI|nr:hypothetical protein CMV_024215 [Castanea mollissima]
MTNTNKDSRSKRKKCLAYIIAGVIAQIIIIVLFVLLVMRIRNLKVRIDSVSVESHTYTNSSFTVKLNAEISVKNTNFGEFKFDDSTATISYNGTKVGEFTIIKSRAKFRSTKRFNVTVTATSAKVSTKSLLASDLNSGKLPLTSYAKLSGKVHLLMIFKKKKSAELSCSMAVNTKSQAIENLTCK